MGELIPADSARRVRLRWHAIIGLAGLVGLTIAAFTLAHDAGDQALPGFGALLIGLAAFAVALICAAQSWIALFPPSSNRRALARALYTSQLTKYLPAGGFVQSASQIALSRQEGMAAAALRLPVLSLCSVAAGATWGFVLVFDSDLPNWGRALAGVGLLTVAILDRRFQAGLLRVAGRFVRRLPGSDALPPQGAVLRCYGWALGMMAFYGAAFAVLLGDLADIDPLTTAAALCAAWTLGYAVLVVPGGVGIREAVLLAALPGVPAGSLLAASVAHRLLGLVSEAAMAGVAHLREAVVNHRSTRPSNPSTVDQISSGCPTIEYDAPINRQATIRPALSARGALRWPLIEAHLDGIDPATILELGAGTGGLALYLASRAKYVGVEPDDASRAIAECRIDRAIAESVVESATRIISDVSDLEDDDSFDLVCAFEVLEHVADDVGTLSQWSEHVRPGGHVLVSVPADPHRFGAWDEFAGHLRRYSPADLAKLFEAAQLDPVDVSYYGYPIGAALDAAYNWIARRRLARPSTPHDLAGRTAQSARRTSAPSWVSRPIGYAMAPFRLLQRRYPDRGVGLVGLAHRP